MMSDRVTLSPMPGLRYRIGKVTDDGSVTVEVAERGSDEWHVLASHKTVEAAVDQISALNESEAALNGPPLPIEDFVSAVKQVLQAKPEQVRTKQKH